MLLSSTTTLGSSSDAPLLCLVLRFFGGSLGSDSLRLHVTRAFERLFGRVERGAIVVEEREESGWAEVEGCGQRAR